jgi:hypothetical protein
MGVCDGVLRSPAAPLTHTLYPMQHIWDGTRQRSRLDPLNVAQTSWLHHSGCFVQRLSVSKALLSTPFEGSQETSLSPPWVTLAVSNSSNPVPSIQWRTERVTTVRGCMLAFVRLRSIKFMYKPRRGTSASRSAVSHAMMCISLRPAGRRSCLL